MAGQIRTKGSTRPLAQARLGCDHPGQGQADRQPGRFDPQEVPQARNPVLGLALDQEVPSGVPGVLQLGPDA